MTITEFQDELRKLHSDFTVIRASSENQTASVLFRGVYQFAIGANGIYQHPNDTYGLQHPSGRFIRHRTLPEAMAMAKKVVKEMHEGGENYRAMMGIGEFSDSSLRAGSEQLPPEAFQL